MAGSPLKSPNKLEIRTIIIFQTSPLFSEKSRQGIPSQGFNRKRPLKSRPKPNEKAKDRLPFRNHHFSRFFSRSWNFGGGGYPIIPALNKTSILCPPDSKTVSPIQPFFGSLRWGERGVCYTSPRQPPHFPPPKLPPTRATSRRLLQFFHILREILHWHLQGIYLQNPLENNKTKRKKTRQGRWFHRPPGFVF